MGKQIGGSGAIYSKFIKILDNGEIYVLGDFTGNCDFDPGSKNVIETSAGKHMYALNLNAEGNFMNVNTSAVLDESMSVESYRMDVDAFGNVYVIGTFSGSFNFNPSQPDQPEFHFVTDSFYYNGFILIMKKSGEAEWVRKNGGSNMILTYDNAVSEQNDLFITGFFSKNAKFGTINLSHQSTNLMDAFITKMNSNGEFKSANAFGGTGGGGHEIEIGENRDIYLSSSFHNMVNLNSNPNTIEKTTTSYYSVFLHHLNNQGEFLSVTKIGESTDLINPMFVDVDIEGVAYMAGYFGADFSLGLVNGVETTLSANNFYNSFSLKINHDGKFKWVNQLTGTAGNVAYEIAVNSKKQVLISGYYGGTMNVGPTDLTNQTENSMESFLTKIDSQGHSIKAYRFGEVNFVDNCGMGIDSQNNIYLSGSFENGVDLNPDAGHDIVSNSAGF